MAEQDAPVIVTDGHTDHDHRANAGLLDAELPDPRFVDASYLRWLYDENPLGPAIIGNIDDDERPPAERRVAHYGLIPQRYRDAAGPRSFVFSLNAVTRSGGQRKGLFSTLCRTLWSRASEAGVACIVGVTNDKSITPVVRLGWRHVEPLPARVVHPARRSCSDVEHYEVTAELLAGTDLDPVLDGLDGTTAGTGWRNCWTPDYLRWRLASPNSLPYAVHASDDLVAVTVRTAVAGVPMLAVAKLLARHGRTGLDATPLIASACRARRAVAAVYAGHNVDVAVRGTRLPDRFKPAPLNLMVYSMRDDIDQDAFTFDVFEFLDMDAY